MRSETKEERKARWAKRNAEDWRMFKENIPILVGFLLFEAFVFVWIYTKTMEKPMSGTAVSRSNVSRARTSAEVVEDAPPSPSSSSYVPSVQVWESEGYKAHQREEEERRRAAEHMLFYQQTIQPFIR